MEQIIKLEEFPNRPLLFGNYDNNIKLLKKTFNVEIITRDNIIIQGEKEDIEKTGKVIFAIQEQILKKGNISPTQVEEIVGKFVQKENSITQEDFPVRPRTQGQKDYMQAIREHEIVFGIGPAGTGKTYLAVAMAIEALQRGTARKIVLVRPAVEAGERLGFLPGDYQAKINPYLRPLYDSLWSLLPPERMRKYTEKGMVEIAPLAYMRGRTLYSSFIILDEAQNTTITQMKMFLTRLGLSSRMVITGDVTQVDLANNEDSGLIHAQNILQSISTIRFFYFSPSDIVRHNLVQKIVEAYEVKNSMPNEKNNSNLRI